MYGMCHEAYNWLNRQACAICFLTGAGRIRAMAFCVRCWPFAARGFGPGGPCLGERFFRGGGGRGRGPARRGCRDSLWRGGLSRGGEVWDVGARMLADFRFGFGVVHFGFFLIWWRRDVGLERR